MSSTSGAIQIVRQRLMRKTFANLHHSQKEVLPFGEHDGQYYGEVRLTIEPNRELRGRILLYGQNLEVISPLSLREQIKDIIRQQMDTYYDNK